MEFANSRQELQRSSLIEAQGWNNPGYKNKKDVPTLKALASGARS